MKNEIEKYFYNEIETIKALNISNIEKVIEILDDALKNNKKIYIFGNGGSGSTASHFVCDFNKAIFKNIDKKFDFQCLNDNMAIVSAISNDIDYSEIFKYQLKNKLKKEDIVIALSGSGNSKNIIKACEYAKEIGAKIIGFTGYNGGILKQISDVSIDTNINDMQITEDIHLMIEHLIIRTFYNMYGEGKYE